MNSRELKEKLLVELLARKYKNKELTHDLIVDIEREFNEIISKTNAPDDKDKEYFADSYENIFDSVSKDEDSFETKITYIASGSIVLFFTYIASGETPFKCKSALILAIILLGGSLSLNLFSYLMGKKWKMNLGDGILACLEEKTMSRKDIGLKLHDINKKIDRINWASFICLFFGMVFATIFITNN
jgi:hypothetical protein